MAGRQNTELRGAAAPAEHYEASLEFRHLVPVEQGGITIEELRRAMMLDGELQDESVPFLCSVLETTVAAHNSAAAPWPASRADRRVQPTPTVTYITKRMLRRGRCSTCSLVVAMMYLERLQAMQGSDVLLTSDTFDTRLLVALMVSSKFCDDDGVDNAAWARIGGISLRRLNELEVAFLYALDWRMGVRTEEYKAFLGPFVLNDVPPKFLPLRQHRAGGQRQGDGQAHPRGSGRVRVAALDLQRDLGAATRARPPGDGRAPVRRRSQSVEQSPDEDAVRGVRLPSVEPKPPVAQHEAHLRRENTAPALAVREAARATQHRSPSPAEEAGPARGVLGRAARAVVGKGFRNNLFAALARPAPLVAAGDGEGPAEGRPAPRSLELVRSGARESLRAFGRISSSQE